MYKTCVWQQFHLVLASLEVDLLGDPGGHRDLGTAAGHSLELLLPADWGPPEGWAGCTRHLQTLHWKLKVTLNALLKAEARLQKVCGV